LFGFSHCPEKCCGSQFSGFCLDLRVLCNHRLGIHQLAGKSVVVAENHLGPGKCHPALLSRGRIAEYVVDLDDAIDRLIIRAAVGPAVS